MTIETVNAQKIDIPETSVGVLDKSVHILRVLEHGPASLSQLVEKTGYTRSTVHRLATALECHQLTGRNSEGKYVLGIRLAELAAAAGEDRLLANCDATLQMLLERTGESAQIYRRQGDQRVCIASVERSSGLRDSIPVGALLSMNAGSAAHILMAWEDSVLLYKGLKNARFTAGTLTAVRKRGWAESVNEREHGVSSVSAPIRNARNQVVAAISISRPTDRMGISPGRHYAPIVMSAGNYLTEILSNASHA